MTSHPTVSRTRIRTRRILALIVVAAAVAITAMVAIPLASAPSATTSVESSPDIATGAEAELEGATAFDDIPAVTRMNPDLLRALQKATEDAALEDVDIEITSGWRSPEYQDQLLQDAVAQYGSREEAARWVASSKTSAHVSGDAVDVGGFEATLWLEKHGAAYGLCQIYDNEAWHFELRPEAPEQGCPDVYWDPTFDPRMQG